MKVIRPRKPIIGIISENIHVIERKYENGENILSKMKYINNGNNIMAMKILMKIIINAMK
jgi:hypothetical protein